MEQPKPFTQVPPKVRSLTPPPRPPAKPETRSPKPTPKTKGGAVAALLLLFCLLFGFEALAQYTTNVPGIRTDVALSFTTNGPGASAVGYTNWPPAPTFGGFRTNSTNSVLSLLITNVSWTVSTNPVVTNGVLQVWRATNATNWALMQEFARTGSVVNTSLYCSSAAPTGSVFVKLRFRKGPWASAFSNPKTNSVP